MRWTGYRGDDYSWQPGMAAKVCFALGIFLAVISISLFFTGSHNFRLILMVRVSSLALVFAGAILRQAPEQRHHAITHLLLFGAFAAILVYIRHLIGA